MVLVEVGSGVRVVAATAKFDILRGPFVVSPQVNGACSCLEGGRPQAGDTTRVNGRE